MMIDRENQVRPDRERVLIRCECGARLYASNMPRHISSQECAARFPRGPLPPPKRTPRDFEIVRGYRHQRIQFRRV
jgi:hypothetical protein